jgi:hypothetical protein
MLIGELPTNGLVDNSAMIATSTTKKDINMEKTDATASLSSLAKGGKGGDPLVSAFKGAITGLEFDFGDGFALDLGGFEVTIRSVEVQASGQELTVVILPKQFFYSASLSEGWHSANGKIVAHVTLDFGESGGIVEDVLEFEFDSATIFERFKIRKKDRTDIGAHLKDITVPKKMDLFFEVTNARLIGPESLLSSVPESSRPPPSNLVLIINKGKAVQVETFEFLTP